MVEDSPRAQTGNRNRRSTPAGRGKEVKQRFQKPRYWPSAIRDGRWHTQRYVTELERPTEGRSISGG